LGLASGSRAGAGGFVAAEDEGVGCGAAGAPGRFARWYTLYQLARMLLRLRRWLLAGLGLLLPRSSGRKLLGDNLRKFLDIAILGMESERESCFGDVGVFGCQGRIELYALAGGWV